MPDLGEAINLECILLQGCKKLKQIHSSMGLLRKLTILNLRGCTSLIKLPSFSEDLNLENLDLEGCRQLGEINQSIGLLRKLTFLNLKDCKSLVSLPNSILGLNSLEYLNLSGCSKLQLLGEARDGEAPIRSHTTLSVIKWWLYSRAHKDSVRFLWPSSYSFPLPCMRELDLSFCNLVQIPDAIGNLSCLEILKLRGNKFVKLPDLMECSKLHYLNLQDCEKLKYLPQLPSRTFSLSNVYILPLLHRGRISRIIIPRNDMTYESIIPGSEIPRWFKYQRAGNHSIPYHAVNFDGFLAVLACVVFAIWNIRYDGIEIPADDGYVVGKVTPSKSDEMNEAPCWDLRVHLALDVARGLEYVHDGAVPPVIHRDIKSSNILLDQSMRGRVSDFGLSREEMVDKHAAIHGTLAILTQTKYLQEHSRRKVMI
ncbi:Calcium/calmodulin-regulated receptor-like kinase 1, partial [Mucuna pruriens]